MTQRPGPVVVFYGAFLILCGVMGFFLTGESSTSSIVNGVVFGSLMVVMGFLLSHGRPWTLPASTSATGIFTVTFAWRGVLEWYRVLRNGDDRVEIAVLLTIMFVVSLGLALLLIQRVRR